MKVKCYALFDGTKQIISEFSNVSQRSFLDYELKNSLKRAKKSGRIQFEHTSNGVWYSKVSDKSTNIFNYLANKTHLVLLSKQYASISLASSIISIGQQLDQGKTPFQKFRMKINETIRTTNANKKLDQISANVSELQGIVKGNITKITTNMQDLDSVERKSEMMTSLSLQFQQDSKKLQEKMKRRNCMIKLAIGGGITLVLVLVIYFLFILQ